MHDSGKTGLGVAPALCVTNCRANSYLDDLVACGQDVFVGWTLAGVIVTAQACSVFTLSYPYETWCCLQHLARARSQTFVLPIDYMIQMPQCLSGFLNHDYYYQVGKQSVNFVTMITFMYPGDEPKWFLVNVTLEELDYVIKRLRPSTPMLTKML